ncbi:CLIP domain-containing serine protease B15-like [Armigeres subalbatus]|uniref:CLIP domain-containing serine protease B15-like n=1 Tax=Armigeres subalbatus TaxID=124917 RepID=UPI002ED0B393
MDRAVVSYGNEFKLLDFRVDIFFRDHEFNACGTLPCQAMDGSEGKCVPVDDCRWILSKPALLNDAFENSACGFGPELVCCPRWQNAENCGQTLSYSEPERFPWVVSIAYRVKRRIFYQRCTGSLINSQYVLTVAHCIADLSFRWKLYSIRVKRDEIYKDYGILRSIVHPNYNRYNLNKDDDVALLKLADRVEFDAHVQPICLTRQDDLHSALLEGQMFTIFSRGPPRAGYVPHNKHPIMLPLRNSSVCEKIYRDIRLELSKSQLCVGGEPGKDSCRGDSGGPLMLHSMNRWYQVGLVSLGSEQCGGRIPGIYVKLVDYLDWIEATVDVVD